jgi:hypothetical protein
MERIPMFSACLMSTSTQWGIIFLMEYIPSGQYFVRPMSNPQGINNVHFSTMQVARGKDVDRAFGVLQSRLAIVQGLDKF